MRGLVLTARDLGPAERAQARRLRFRERLLELAIQPKSDFTQTLATVLRSTAEVLDVGAASFWRLSRDPDVLRCEALFDRDRRPLPCATGSAASSQRPASPPTSRS